MVLPRWITGGGRILCFLAMRRAVQEGKSKKSGLVLLGLGLRFGLRCCGGRFSLVRGVREVGFQVVEGSRVCFSHP